MLLTKLKIYSTGFKLNIIAINIAYKKILLTPTIHDKN